MIKGKTKSGFKYEISDENLDNYELIEVMAEIDSNVLLLPKLLLMLLGDEQKKALLNHVRTKDGRVPAATLQAEIMDIFQNHQPVKNGSSLPD